MIGSLGICVYVDMCLCLFLCFCCCFFYTLCLFLMPCLYKGLSVNPITLDMAKNSMERRKWRKFQFMMWKGKFTENYSIMEKPTQSRRDQSHVLGELRQLAIRSHFVPQERHVRIRGARLVFPLGCFAFGDNMASSNHMTLENWSLHVATLSISLEGTSRYCHPASQGGIDLKTNFPT